jgi:hypothetical protein
MMLGLGLFLLCFYVFPIMACAELRGRSQLLEQARLLSYVHLFSREGRERVHVQRNEEFTRA